MLTQSIHGTTHFYVFLNFLTVDRFCISSHCYRGHPVKKKTTDAHMGEPSTPVSHVEGHDSIDAWHADGDDEDEDDEGRLFLYFLVSSICSTSLDSSTTLPLTMVWVTTFTIFLVLTSGSPATHGHSQLLVIFTFCISCLSPCCSFGGRFYPKRQTKYNRRLRIKCACFFMVECQFLSSSFLRTPRICADLSCDTPSLCIKINVLLLPGRMHLHINTTRLKKRVWTALSCIK